MRFCCFFWVLFLNIPSAESKLYISNYIGFFFLLIRKCLCHYIANDNSSYTSFSILHELQVDGSWVLHLNRLTRESSGFQFVSVANNHLCFSQKHTISGPWDFIHTTKKDQKSMWTWLSSAKFQTWRRFFTVPFPNTNLFSQHAQLLGMITPIFLDEESAQRGHVVCPRSHS